jgi:hypothetical protein
VGFAASRGSSPLFKLGCKMQKQVRIKPSDTVNSAGPEGRGCVCTLGAFHLHGEDGFACIGVRFAARLTRSIA